MLLGFTTGKLDKMSFPEKVRAFQEIGCNTIEFSMLDTKRFEVLKENLPKLNLTNFSVRSIHSPCFTIENGVKNHLVYKNDKATRDIFAGIEYLKNNHKIDLVVIHPDLVEDWSAFEEFDIPWAVENMDHRKSVGTTVEDLKKVFEKIDAKMVLDVNHCRTNDPTLKLAADMYAAFGGRIAEIHLSGFKEYHEPLYQTGQTEIIDSILDKNVPIILESTCETGEEYQREYRYVLEKING